MTARAGALHSQRACVTCVQRKRTHWQASIRCRWSIHWYFLRSTLVYNRSSVSLCAPLSLSLCVSFCLSVCLSVSVSYSNVVRRR